MSIIKMCPAFWLTVTVLITVLMMGCNGDTDPCIKLVKYLSEHKADLSKTEVKGEVFATVSYQPFMLIACKGIDDTDSLTSTEDMNEGFHCFQMEIGSQDERGVFDLLDRSFSKEEKTRATNYYSYRMNSDLRLAIGSDTFPCTFYHNVQTGGIYKHMTFFVAFEARAIQNDEHATVLYHDDVFALNFNNFQFEGSKINQIPTKK